MSLVQLISWLVAAFLGAIAHEVAHWIVWLAAGRDPRLDLWGLTVIPRAGPSHVMQVDKVAAAAPYVVGAACCVYGVSTRQALWIIFGLAMIQVPSQADIATIRGNVTWRSLVSTQA